MPTQKKGGFWSTAFHYYYCDDCGEWYYTNTEAEECELKHMKLPFDDSKLAKIIDEKDVQGIISFISYVTNEVKDSSSAAFSNSVFSNFISQSLDMLVDTL